MTERVVVELPESFGRKVASLVIIELTVVHVVALEVVVLEVAGLVYNHVRKKHLVVRRDQDVLRLDISMH